MIDKKILTGILAAVGASLCCITPVLAVLAGSTGFASTFTWMEPFRPYLIVLTIVVLAYAWWDKLKPKKADISCACDEDAEGKVSFWYSKTFLLFVTLFSAVMLSFPYWGDSLIREDKPKIVYVNKANLSKVTVNIEGMTCKACEATVEKVAGDVSGVTWVKASTKEKRAELTYDKSITDIETILKNIVTTGYMPTGYKDAQGVMHQLKELSGTMPVSHKSESKCGEGKCGANKCGNGKCGN